MKLKRIDNQQEVDAMISAYLNGETKHLMDWFILQTLPAFDRMRWPVLASKAEPNRLLDYRVRDMDDRERRLLHRFGYQIDNDGRMKY